MLSRESNKLLSEICVVNIFTLAALKFLISMLVTLNMLTICEIVCLKPKYTVSNSCLRLLFNTVVRKHCDNGINITDIIGQYGITL